MTNIFSSMPEFISTDVRVKRPIDVSYRIDSEFMQKRHEQMLSPELVRGKSVLDLGCAVAATGAWALYHGARYYTGVELQAKMAQDASNNLQKYFEHVDENEPKWEIFCTSIETFLSWSKAQYDIIIVSGVIYGIIDYFGFLADITKRAKEAVIIESMHPWKLMDREGNLTPMHQWAEATKFPIVQYTQKIRHSHEDGTKSYEYDGIRISIGAFEQIFEHLGWKVSLDANNKLGETIPDVYNVEYVTNMDPSNPGDAHLVNIASGPRFVVQAFPAEKTKFDFVNTFAKGQDKISFKDW